MSWLLLSCIASFVIALGLGLALYLNWRAERRAERLEPYDEPFGDCPWPIAEPESRANFHNTSVTNR